MAYTVLYLGCDLEYFDDIQKKYEKILPRTTVKAYSFDYRRATLAELQEFVSKPDVRGVYLDLYQAPEKIIEYMSILKKTEYLIDSVISTISVDNNSFRRHISLLKSNGFKLNYTKTLDSFDITYHNILVGNKEFDTDHDFAYLRTDEEIHLCDMVKILEFRKNSMIVEGSIPREAKKVTPVESDLIGTSLSKIHPSKYMITKDNSKERNGRFQNELLFLYVDPVHEQNDEKRADKEIYRQRKLKKAKQEYSYFLAYNESLKIKQDVQSIVLDRSLCLLKEEDFDKNLKSYKDVDIFSHLTPDMVASMAILNNTHCIFIKAEFEEVNKDKLINKTNIEFIEELVGKLKRKGRNPYITLFAPGVTFESTYLRNKLEYKNISIVKSNLSLAYVNKVHDQVRPYVVTKSDEDILKIDPKFSDAWVRVKGDAKLVALSETEFIFSTENKILPNSLMSIDYPVSADILIVPHSIKTGRQGEGNTYRAIFVGLSESDKSSIRQEINSISVKRKTEAEKKQLAAIEAKKQQILKEREKDKS